MTIDNLDTFSGKFVTPVAYAKYLDVSTRTVYHWVAKGALQVIKFERTVRIPIEEARRFIKSN